MWSLLGSAGVRPFARSLLGLDGKPCAGAKDLSDKIKSDLLEAAN